MSVGYMKDGSLITCATKDDLAAEIAAREAGDLALQEEISQFPAEGRDAGGVWHIYSVDGLKAWRDAANADPSASAVLHNALDLSGVEWSPVESEFTGFFDGGGHTIRGIDISRSVTSASESPYFGGLFDKIMNGSVISGVSLREYRLSMTDTQSDDSEFMLHIGGIVGYTMGLVKNCIATKGTLYASSSNSIINLGGIVGAIYSGGGITGCSAVELEIDSYNTNGHGRIGGMFGVSRGHGIASSLTAIDCSVSGTHDNGGLHIGGICGAARELDDGSTALTGCMASGCTVSAKSTTADIFAGGVGGQVMNCVACHGTTCMVHTETASSYAVAGGVFGRKTGSDIIGCSSWRCTVSSSSSATDLNNYCYAGGVVGYTYGNIVGCTATCAAVTATGSCGYVMAGGVVGNGNPANFSALAANINWLNDDTETYKMLNVSATSTYSSGGYCSAGGIIGMTMGQSIITGCTLGRQNSTVSSSISITATHQGASGIAAVGGVAGFISTSSSCILASSASAYTNDVISASGATAYTGGIAGYVPTGGIVTGNANLTNVTQDIGNQ